MPYVKIRESDEFISAFKLLKPNIVYRLKIIEDEKLGHHRYAYFLVNHNVDLIVWTDDPTDYSGTGGRIYREIEDFLRRNNVKIRESILTRELWLALLLPLEDRSIYFKEFLTKMILR